MLIGLLNCQFISLKMEKKDWKVLTQRLQEIFEPSDQTQDDQEIQDILVDANSSDIALAMEDLQIEYAVCVFRTLDEKMATEVLPKLEPELAEAAVAKLSSDKLAALVKSLPPREAASVVSEAPQNIVKRYLKDRKADPFAVEDLQEKLKYPKNSAGRLMTTDFIRLKTGITAGQAILEIKRSDPNVDLPDGLYVVQPDPVENQKDRLLGVVSIRDLLMCAPNCKVEEIMATEIISIKGEDHEDDAAALISKYKFMTLPVIDDKGHLVGIIPADDLMQVVVARLRRLYSQAVGTDAKTMENLSAFKAAKVRVPWLLGTMAIELLAGVVISHYDAILSQVILLASFMPVISAISGNVGLQSAAITVRALDTKSTGHKNMWASLKKEGLTALMMAITCGLVLGTIGAIWSKHIPFGIVICGALICSTITAALMGTVIPTISKKLGFDPATTAGPFETAFQDVIGFAVFLGLATQLQHWI